MIHFVLLLLTYLAVVCQMTAGDQMSIGGVAPDFLALIVVVAILNTNGKAMLLWAALAGLLGDCLLSERLGIDMLLATLVAYVARRWFNRKTNKSALGITFAGFAIVWVLLTASSTVRLLLVSYHVDLTETLIGCTATAAYTALVSLSLLVVWRFVKQLVPGMSANASAPITNRWRMLDGG